MSTPKQSKKSENKYIENIVVKISIVPITSLLLGLWESEIVVYSRIKGNYMPIARTSKIVCLLLGLYNLLI
jgi:hypothetical protein